MEHIIKLESDIDKFRSVKREYNKYKKLSNNPFFGCFYKKKMLDVENEYNIVIQYLLNSYIVKSIPEEIYYYQYNCNNQVSPTAPPIPIAECIN